MTRFEDIFIDYMEGLCRENPDPSHDILHVKRVVTLAKRLALLENAKMEIVIPAAYLHDAVYISKTDARRTTASLLSADKAIELLKGWGYPPQHLDEIHHAIHAHSFSAGVKTQSLEAQIVQDADRLDAMGAIGALRGFALSGLAKRPLYFEDDPFCETRQPDDSTNTLDHFFVKLLKLYDGLNTNTAKIEGQRRTDTLQTLLRSLKQEII